MSQRARTSGIRLGKRRPAGSIIWALFLGALTSLPGWLPALAAPDVAESGRLNEYEQLVLGKSNSAASPEKRVAAIEQNLFGKSHAGPISTRLDAIGQALGSQGAPPSPVPACDRVMQGRVNINESRPGDETADLLKQGLAQYNSGNYAEAEKTYQQVLSINPQEPHALFNLGAVCEQRGDLDGALSQYRLAARYDHNNSEAVKAAAAVEQEIAQRQQAAARLNVDDQKAQAAEARARAQKEYELAVEQQRRLDKQRDAEIRASAPAPERGGASSAAARGAAAAVAVGAGMVLSGLARRGGGLRGLDISCPICRLLRF